MDEDGYPTEEELDRIRTWSYQDFAGLLEFINAQCWWPRPIAASGSLAIYTNWQRVTGAGTKK